MANVAIRSDEWTVMPITSGTVQNISTNKIEISSEQTDGTGLVLESGELYGWDGKTIYARVITPTTGAAVRVVDFKKSAGGGGGSYVLPIASAAELGGIKVGNNLTIDANGVLSGTAVSGGQNYSTTEQLVGTWIDGKPLYQKTYSGTIPMGADSGSTNIFADSATISIIESGFVISGYIIQNTDFYMINSIGFESMRQNVIFISKNNNSIRGRVTVEYVGCPIVVTIQYTKTTD
jgi:hypothetical protein